MAKQEGNAPEKPARFHFPDQYFLKPENYHPSDDNINAVPESVVLDTHFANLFRGWMRDKRIGYDATVHEAFKQVVQEYIEKAAAVEMVTKDVAHSAKATGVGLNMDIKSVNKLTSSLLEISFTKEVVCALGLSEYADDIVAMELTKAFNAPTTLSKKRQQQQRDDSEWLKKTASGIHNMVREIASSVKHSKFMPAPVSPNVKARATRNILNSLREENAVAPNAPASEGGIPGPS